MLVVEGETERRTAVRILGDLGPQDAPHLVQIVAAGGVARDLQLLAAATVAPLLGERHPDGYDLLRPPCHLFVVVDPEGKYATPEKVETQRENINKAVAAVARAQRDDVDLEDLESLVSLQTWTGGQFEFSHFTDFELLTAITAVHTDPSARPADADLLTALADARSRGLDLKAVWHKWAYEPPKPKLADALWPILRRKIEAAESDGDDLPQIASAVYSAYEQARMNSQGTWVIGIRSEKFTSKRHQPKSTGSESP